MKAVVQRVNQAKVLVNKQVVGQISTGYLVLLGINNDDTFADVTKLVDKLVSLRIMSDENARMNKSITDVGKEILVVSQFTLYASFKKGNRPSFMAAAPAKQAQQLYQEVVERLQQDKRLQRIETGRFGADMKVELTNDGPVTIIIETKEI